MFATLVIALVAMSNTYVSRAHARHCLLPYAVFALLSVHL